MKNFLEDLKSALETKSLPRVRSLLEEIHLPDLASIISQFEADETAILFRALPRKRAASVFEYLPFPDQQALLTALAKEEVGPLLDEMSPDDRTSLFEELPGNITKELLALLSTRERAVAVKLLRYPENSVGRLMTPDLIAVSPEWTVAQVLDFVRLHGQDSETFTMVFVIDEKGKLIDDIFIRKILLSPPEKKVSDLLDYRFTSLKATDGQSKAIDAFRKENAKAIPVTDSEGILMGIVTVDDVLELAEYEATREIQRVGGSEALDEPYMTINIFRMVRKRASWLVFLFLGEMLTATAMSFYEVEISKAVVLALFVPLIISSGGNSGSQAATLVIRAMALGEVKLADWWRVMRREVVSGLLLGIILGLLGFLRISIWSAFSTIYGPHWLLVALTVGISLVGIVLWGSLAGSTLPLVLRRLGFDPATSSAPFVATLVDVTGLVIYFAVAMLVLKGTLL